MRDRLLRGCEPVADLLECLIQIKGVADTPRRLAVRVERVDAALQARGRSESGVLAVVVALASAEPRFRQCVELMLARDRPALPPIDEPPPPGDEAAPLEDWLRRFALERHATVHVLEACSADDLNRIGVEALRGPMTVADLVAVMLARDTDYLGRLIDLECRGAAGEGPGGHARLGGSPPYS
jgi:hypothetical protein